jgi:outer membrane protein TolC
MKKIILLFLLSSQVSLYAQDDILILDSCIIWAKKHYPLLKQSNLINSNSEVNLKAINENWFPQLSFLVKANYQSEVVVFPGVNYKFPHDTYLSSVSLNQTIYDGGQTKQQKLIEGLNSTLDLQKNEIEMYRIIEQVNQLYVTILLSRENLNVLNIYKNNIDNRISNLKIASENGLALQSSLDEFEAESLKTEQGIIEAQENLKAFYKSLEFYIGSAVSEKTILKPLPLGGITNGSEIQRPEIKFFDIQKELMDSKYDLTSKLALPKVSLYADVNYGRPGPNFLNQNLRGFANTGVSVKWNIGSLYGLSREKNRLTISQQMIDVQKENFLFNVNNTLISQTIQINSIKEIIEKDKLIVEKRHNVTLSALSQLENGKITSTDYLTQLNAELQAKLNQKIHEIRLMNAMTSYNATKGITNF